MDAVLEPFLRKQPPAPVRHVLRLGAAGLLLLGTPAHAAVATSVALARARGLAPFAGLVNAVLRRLAASGVAALEGLDGPRLDTPAWLWASWGAEARAIAEAHQHEAPLDLTLRTAGAGARAEPPPGGEALPTGSWRYPAGTRVAELPGYAEGAFWVQDASAALPARLLAARPGELVADLCSAPGGKSAQLAAAGARLTAVERDPVRLDLQRGNFARLRLEASFVVADAASWRPDVAQDAVLLDAPCSATGTIRRHPDLPHLKRPRDIAAMTAQQHALLEAAVAMLRPGGRLVYAVCSLQPEEGPLLVADALTRLPLRPDPIGVDEVPGLAGALTPTGALRTTPALWPDRGGLDGFFVARLIREV